MGIPQSNRRHGGSPPADTADGPYDPTAHNIATVMAHVQDHPDEAQAILDAELASDSPRVTLIAQLEQLVNGGT